MMFFLKMMMGDLVSGKAGLTGKRLVRWNKVRFKSPKTLVRLPLIFRIFTGR